MSPAAEAALLRDRLSAELPFPGTAIAVVLVADARRDALPAEEREYAARFRVPKRHDEWVAGRLAAREALRSTSSAATHPDPVSSLRITTAPGVPPRVLRGETGVAVGVSIAHAGGLAAAVAFPLATPIGIDLEPATALAPGLADLTLAPAERNQHDAHVAAGADPVLSLLRFWTAKEAAVKLSGTGFAVPFQRVVVLGAPEDPVGSPVVLRATSGADTTSCRVRTLHVGSWVAALAWHPA